MDMSESEKLKQEGNSFFAGGDYISALTKYTESICSNQDNPVLYSNRAATYLKLEKWANAIKDCDSGLNILKIEMTGSSNLRIKLLCRKSIGQRNSGDLHSALETITDALKLAPTNSALKSELDIINSLLPKSNEKKLEIESSETQPKDKVETSNSLENQIVSIQIQDVETIPLGFFVQSVSVDEASKSVSNSKPTIQHEIHNKKHQSTNTPSYAYPSHPTVQFLQSIKAKPTSIISSYYTYVFDIDKAHYEKIYSVTGLDPEFLNFFLDSCIYVLGENMTDYKSKIINLLILFKKLPRFSLTSMFADSSKVKKLQHFFDTKLHEDFNLYWS